MKALISFIICLFISKVTPAWWIYDELIELKTEEYNEMKQICENFYPASGAGFMKVHYRAGPPYIYRYGYRLDAAHSRFQISKFALIMDTSRGNEISGSKANVSEICIWKGDFDFFVKEKYSFTLLLNFQSPPTDFTYFFSTIFININWEIIILNNFIFIYIIIF